MLGQFINQAFDKCHPFIGSIIAAIIFTSISLIIIGYVIIRGNEKLRKNEFRKIAEQINFISRDKLSKSEVLETVKKCVKLYEDEGGPSGSKSKIHIYNILEGSYKGNNLIVFDMKTSSNVTLYSSPSYDTIIWTEIVDSFIPDFDLFDARSSIISDAVIKYAVLPFMKLLGYKSPAGEIKVNNVEFSKKYSLYSKDGDGLRIFSPAVMEYFVKSDFRYNISTRGNKMVIYPYSSHQYPIQAKDLMSFINKSNEAIGVLKKA